jgi:hypothetical protein
VDALKEAIERNTSLPPEARTHPGKVIFSCDANGQAIDAGEYCYYSCLLEGGFAICTCRCDNPNLQNSYSNLYQQTLKFDISTLQGEGESLRAL